MWSLRFVGINCGDNLVGFICDRHKTRVDDNMAPVSLVTGEVYLYKSSLLDVRTDDVSKVGPLISWGDLNGGK